MNENKQGFLRHARCRDWNFIQFLEFRRTDGIIPVPFSSPPFFYGKHKYVNLVSLVL